MRNLKLRETTVTDFVKNCHLIATAFRCDILVRNLLNSNGNLWDTSGFFVGIVAFPFHWRVHDRKYYHIILEIHQTLLHGLHPWYVWIKWENSFSNSVGNIFRNLEIPRNAADYKFLLVFHFLLLGSKLWWGIHSMFLRIPSYFSTTSIEKISWLNM